jgi:hypothetical protein
MCCLLVTVSYVFTVVGYCRSDPIPEFSKVNDVGELFAVPRDEVRNQPRGSEFEPYIEDTREFMNNIESGSSCSWVFKIEPCVNVRFQYQHNS